jgi:pimeloyl-ACP methyl ester carboxylesterase
VCRKSRFRAISFKKQQHHYISGENAHSINLHSIVHLPIINSVNGYRYLTYDKFILPYRVLGKGEQMLVAFHGFGGQGLDFLEFEPTLGHKYSIYIFDLFYHGEKALDLNRELKSADPSIMAQLIEKLLWEEKRVKFSMIGYSLGGRIALCLIQKLPHRINELFLVAPDGLNKAWHEIFVTKTWLGKHLYGRIIVNPGLFFSLVNILSSLKLITPKLRQFILSNMDDNRKRLLIYRTWKVFSNLQPDLDLISHYLNTRKIRLELIFGQFDQIIKPVFEKKLTRKLKKKVPVHILDSGHLLLSKVSEISNMILKP